MKSILSDAFLKKGVYVNSLNNAMLTITEIKVSPDLKHAKVFLSSMDKNIDRQMVIDSLNRKVSFYRQIIAKKVRIKKIPSLKFSYDTIYRFDMLIDEDIDE